MYMQLQIYCQKFGPFHALFKNDVEKNSTWHHVYELYWSPWQCFLHFQSAAALSSEDWSLLIQQRENHMNHRQLQTCRKKRGSGEIINIYLWKVDWNLWNSAPISEIIFKPIKDSSGQSILQIPMLNYLFKWQNTLERLLVSSDCSWIIDSQADVGRWIMRNCRDYAGDMPAHWVRANRNWCIQILKSYEVNQREMWLDHICILCCIF